MAGSLPRLTFALGLPELRLAEMQTRTTPALVALHNAKQVGRQARRRAVQAGKGVNPERHDVCSRHT